MILVVPNLMPHEQFIRPLPETELVGIFRSIKGKEKILLVVVATAGFEPYLDTSG
jgi:hypothetical protein